MAARGPGGWRFPHEPRILGAMTIMLKRVYEPAAKSDGQRILVERLWPRGLTKEAAAIDHWAKDVAPSPALRQWYSHDMAKWPEFQVRYRAELKANEDAVAALRAQCHARRTTFVYASKDEARNSALVLRSFLETTA